MKEFQFLVRRKNKALSVFTRARDELAALVNHIVKARHEAETAILREKEKAAFLAAEHSAVEQHIAKIEQVIGQ